MRRHHLIIGRALVLIIVGAGIGLALYLAHHLSPRTLERQVREALAEVFRAEFDMAPVVLDLNFGIELRDLKVYYDRAEPAIEVDRILLFIDKEELIRGEVKIPQATASGVVVRLRADPALGGMPGLPGIFRRREGPMPRSRLPLIRIRGGGSRIEIDRAPFLPSRTPLTLQVGSLEGEPDGRLYRLHAELEEERLGRFALRVSYDPDAEELAVGTEPLALELPAVLALAGVDSLV
ncbi:MAG: hypothetical protein ACE5JG_10620, partial [Planctomycetota bacterium]